MNFDQDCVSVEDLELARTKAAIFQKLQVIFIQRDAQNSLGGAAVNSSGAISKRTFGKRRGNTKWAA